MKIELPKNWKELAGVSLSEAITPSVGAKVAIKAKDGTILYIGKVKTIQSDGNIEISNLDPPSKNQSTIVVEPKDLIRFSEPK